MATKLSRLFDERVKQKDLIASDPQTLDDISSRVEEQNFVIRRLKLLEETKPKVDFRSFGNFVFFNSALDYFNITAENILNQYPYGGTVDKIQEYENDLDDYQRYVLNEAWPKSSGHLRFNPSFSSSYALVDDVGRIDGSSKGGVLSPGTGSLSIDFWTIPPPVLTGSNDVMFVIQKSSGSNNYSVFFSGSSAFFQVISGSNTDVVSIQTKPGENSYYSFVYDKDRSQIFAYSGSVDEFPTRVTSSSISITGDIRLGTTKVSIASGTLLTKITRPLTGALDNLKIWKTPIDMSYMSSSFNTKTYAQNGLMAHWRFNESRITGSFYKLTGSYSLFLDYSGHEFDGRIISPYYGIRSSGSLVPYETPDQIMSYDAPQIRDYIEEQQVSGTNYDRENDNLITRQLPAQFFIQEKDVGLTANFLYVIARQFDQIKVSIDQFLYVLRANYSRYNQTPDALLSDIGRFYGWDFTGNFLNADAIQWLLGKSVLGNLEANKELEIKLHEIKNEFWRRTLNNLPHLYKTKGTRESVESLLRVYGVDRSFVRLKEYGFKPKAGIGTFRIKTEKSSPALTFGSASLTSSQVWSAPIQTSMLSVESRVRFPTLTTSGMTASLLTGSIWTINSTGSMYYNLSFARESLDSHTGSFILSSSAGQLVLSEVEAFDNEWYNVAVVRDPVSSSFKISVKSIDDGQVVKSYLTSSSVNSFNSGSYGVTLWLGRTGSIPSEMWTQEIRVWNQPLDDLELTDHALNYQSFGTTEVDGLPDLSLHWRLSEQVTASIAGNINGDIIDVSGKNIFGSGSGFLPSVSPYKKFLNQYNFIAPPDYGWNEDRIRVLNSSLVDPAESFVENTTVALEFNMIDALNEDISQIIATMDGFNNSIGLPANRYRSSYYDLEILRRNYFKRLQGRLHFRVFSDMLEFFDRSFIDMVKQLIPAHVIFLGDEFVIESHMLERPKLQWNYRRAERKFEPEGTIKVYIRT